MPTPLPGYELNELISDEFNSDSGLNLTKWGPSPHWRGRQPGLFDTSNVVVGGGYLQLWARAAKRNNSWPAGYDNYTTAAIHSFATQQQGFFEIRWRSGSSGISSSWWFHDNNGSSWTEIDVFETTGQTNPEKYGANASRSVKLRPIQTSLMVWSAPSVPPQTSLCSSIAASQGVTPTPPPMYLLATLN